MQWRFPRHMNVKPNAHQHLFALPLSVLLVLAACGGGGGGGTPSAQSCANTADYVCQGGLSWTPNNLTSAVNYSTAPTPSTPTAVGLCASGNFLGQTGWRLPTKLELEALYASGALSGKNWTLNYTWSTTPDANGWHFGVNLLNGSSATNPNDAGTNYVTCVR